LIADLRETTERRNSASRARLLPRHRQPRAVGGAGDAGSSRSRDRAEALGIGVD
jgi:hypothetical protein